MHDFLNRTQAAKVIGCSPQKVAEMGKRGLWKFVEVIPAKELGRGTRNDYLINRYRLARELEITDEEVNRRLEAK